MKRVVMGTRSNGLADVLFEDDLNVGEAQQIRDLWLNRETPANVATVVDPTAGQALSHEPPDGGATFRLIVFPPSSTMQWPTPEQMVQFHKSIHSVHVPTAEYLKSAKHVSMHRTDTLNYFVVTEGELWALSEGKDVLLKPGDCLIQLGCMHGWDNRSDKRAVMACVLIDAHSPF